MRNPLYEFESLRDRVLRRYDLNQMLGHINFQIPETETIPIHTASGNILGGLK